MRPVADSAHFIVGGGVSGLAAGIASGASIYESQPWPGGICATYYVEPVSGRRSPTPPEDGNAYRFEVGGGHWIWGADPVVWRLFKSMVEWRTYVRRAAVFLPSRDLIVPYPLQYHLRYLGQRTGAAALREMEAARSRGNEPRTLADWLKASFGDTLCELFFGPFHNLYTAGLWKEVAAPDEAKSPADLRLAAEGLVSANERAGYNAEFHYPIRGLDSLVQRMATACRLHVNRTVAGINVERSVVRFADGAEQGFHRVLSTLPLSTAMKVADLKLPEESDPFTSVIVINIGAGRGPACPDAHWMYVPASRSGLHRVGFYGNVDSTFLPASYREERTSLYVEIARRGGDRPNAAELSRICRSVVGELTEWGWIRDTEIVDPTWVEVAYTWTRPGSRWRARALAELEASGVLQVGRYARWETRVQEQGIAQSVRSGLAAGVALRQLVT